MQLEYICNQVKNKNEIAIIKEYNYTARRQTIILTSKKNILRSMLTIVM